MGKKHKGEFLSDVAKSDPSYLQWMYHEQNESMDNEVYYALEDALKRHGISLVKEKRRAKP
jgi:hypothetical protein